METQHPWQAGPSELVYYALQHLNRPGQFDQRMALLLLDAGVETVLRTYLELPARITKARMLAEERHRAARASLQEVMQAVQAAAGPRLQGIDLRDIEHYEEFCDRLYRQGQGMPIPPQEVRGYAELAVVLLRRLLGVDLEAQLLSLHQELDRQQREAASLDQIRNLQARIATVATAVDRNVRAVMEALEPAFLMPSFERDLQQWLKQLDPELVKQGLQTLDRKAGLRPADPGVARTLHTWMPSPLRGYVTRHGVEPVSLAFQLGRAHTTTETLLVLAGSALDLCPRGNAAGIYWLAHLLREEDPLADRSAWEQAGYSLPSPLAAFRERCEEALADLESVRTALERNMKRLHVAPP